jgi:hypothetical protein
MENNMTQSKIAERLLKNIYFMALHHAKLNESLMNDLSRDDNERAKDEGHYNAYSYVVQMVRYSESIGSTDYKKIHKISENFPTLYER